MPFKHRQGGPQRLACLVFSAFAAQHVREDTKGNSGVGVIWAEGSAADLESILEGGEGSCVVPPGSEKLAKEMHGTCVLCAPHALAGEEVPAMFDEPLGVVQPTFSARPGRGCAR